MGVMALMIALLLAAQKRAGAFFTPSAAPPTPQPPAKPPTSPAAAPAAAPPAAAKPAPAAKPAAVPWPVATFAKDPKTGKPVPVPTFQMAPGPDLPKFPTGWEADVPPKSEVTKRAGQLLAELWKSGKPGATKVESIGGRWITFQAYAPAKGKRSVVAYRVKGAARAA